MKENVKEKVKAENKKNDDEDVIILKGRAALLLAIKNAARKMKLVKNGYNQFQKYHYYTTEDVVKIVNDIVNETQIAIFISDMRLIEHNNQWYYNMTITITRPAINNKSLSLYVDEESYDFHYQAFVDTTQKNWIQKSGASFTYLTRYALMSLLGLADKFLDIDSLDQEKLYKINKINKIEKPAAIEKKAAIKNEDEVKPSQFNLPKSKNVVKEAVVKAIVDDKHFKDFSIKIKNNENDDYEEIKAAEPVHHQVEEKKVVENKPGSTTILDFEDF